MIGHSPGAGAARTARAPTNTPLGSRCWALGTGWPPGVQGDRPRDRCSGRRGGGGWSAASVPGKDVVPGRRAFLPGTCRAAAEPVGSVASAETGAQEARKEAPVTFPRASPAGPEGGGPRAHRRGVVPVGCCAGRSGARSKAAWLYLQWPCPRWAVHTITLRPLSPTRTHRSVPETGTRTAPLTTRRLGWQVGTVPREPPDPEGEVTRPGSPGPTQQARPWRVPFPRWAVSSHGSAGCKSEIKVSAACMSPEASLLGSQTPPFSLSPPGAAACAHPRSQGPRALLTGTRLV